MYRMDLYKQKAIAFAQEHIKLVLITSSIVAVTIFSIARTAQIQSAKKASITPTVAPTLTPTPFKDWQTYENKKRGFTVSVPPEWKIEEIVGRAIFTPKDKPTLGSITEITITILNNPQQGQPLTTQEELDEWLAKDAKKEIPEKGRLYKLDNLQVAGQQSVTLVDLGRLGEQDSDDWSIVTWFRKEKENYYIYAKGTQELSDEDIRAYNYVLSTFKFQ